ncbi:RNA polymerase sigma factor [Pontibacter sp. H249]|uniref:RNA polymerase sigma factor n=1 Tax=Pontibacter sp. H249 TaxID=3133420 RepID=UPI0030BD617D
MAGQHPIPKLTEEDLVSRMRAHDSSAMSVLYDMYSATLYGVVLQIVKIEETAEDVLQESFVKIWNSFDSYDASKGRLFTWMLNICRNQAIDTIRSKHHRVNSKTENISTDTRLGFSADGFKPEHVGVRDMIDNLNPEQKHIIDLMYFKGLTQSEIAETYNIPLGTVKTRARTAVKLLARFFKGRA